MRFVLLVWVLVASGCLSKRIHEEQSPKGNIFDFEELTNLLGKELGVVKNATYTPDVLVRDTTLESEGVTWPGLVFYRNNRGIFLAETNWERKQTISRVIIIDSYVRSFSGIAVGSKFKDIRSGLSRSIPSYPDGYLGLQDINNPGVTYFFDVDPNSKEAFGDVTFDTIPGDLEVTQIFIEDAVR